MQVILSGKSIDSKEEQPLNVEPKIKCRITNHLNRIR